MVAAGGGATGGDVVEAEITPLAATTTVRVGYLLNSPLPVVPYTGPMFGCLA